MRFLEVSAKAWEIGFIWSGEKDETNIRPVLNFLEDKHILPFFLTLPIDWMLLYENFKVVAVLTYVSLRLPIFPQCT